MNHFPHIPGYTLQKVLGQGGMATVYLAIQDSLAREVALKVMQTDHSRDNSIADRFIHEAKIVARLSHAHIVPLYDVGRTDQCCYLAMEYLPNQSLAVQISQGMKPGQILKVARDIASALDVAHQKGYIHRNVKPSNILFRADGTAVLTDFGITRPDNKAQQTLPFYASPEQIRNEEVDSTCDLYAFGIVLYEMLVGKPPFQGKDAAEITSRHLTAPIPRLPANMLVFQRLIDGLLAKQNSERTQSAKQVVDAVDAIYQVLRQKTGHKSKPVAAEKPVPSQAKAVESIVSHDIYNADTLIREGLHADASERKRTGNESRWITPDMPTPNPIKKSRWPMVLLLLISPFLLGLLLVAFAPLIAPNTPLMTAHKTIESWFLQPMPVIDPRVQQIEEYLSLANTSMQKKHYLEPVDDSAYFYYQRILALDELNSAAKQGMLDIAQVLVGLANNALQQDQLTEAAKLLADARKVANHAPGLLAAEVTLRRKEHEQQQLLDNEAAARLEQEAAMREKERLAKAKQVEAAAAAEAAARQRLLKEQYEEMEKHKEYAQQQAKEAAAAALLQSVRIRGLLAKAHNHTARGEYYSPEDDNALTSYAEVLELDKNNSDAIAGITQIVELVIADLEALNSSGSIKEAQAIYLYVLKFAHDKTPLYQFAEAALW